MEQELQVPSKSVKFRNQISVDNEGKRKVKDDFDIFSGVVSTVVYLTKIGIIWRKTSF